METVYRTEDNQIFTDPAAAENWELILSLADLIEDLLADTPMLNPQEDGILILAGKLVHSPKLHITLVPF